MATTFSGPSWLKDSSFADIACRLLAPIASSSPKSVELDQPQPIASADSQQPGIWLKPPDTGYIGYLGMAGAPTVMQISWEK